MKLELLPKREGYCYYCGGKVRLHNEENRRKFWCSKLCYCSFLILTKISKMRKFIWLKFNKKCVICGTQLNLHKNGKRPHLEVHHIIPKKFNGSDEPSNLEARCPKCHKIETLQLIRELKNIKINEFIEQLIEKDSS